MCLDFENVYDPERTEPFLSLRDRPKCLLCSLTSWDPVPLTKVCCTSRNCSLDPNLGFHDGRKEKYKCINDIC